MSAYSRGRNFEWVVRDHLADNGYSVSRMAGSKGDAKIDLLAIKPGQMLFVQAKTSARIDPDEWDRLVEVAGWVGALPIVAAKGGRGQGIQYTRLLGPKRRGCRNQDVEQFVIDEIAAAVV